MEQHLDIRLLPDPEFAQQHLMSALFAKLHRALVQLGSSDIGISFPEVEPDAPMLGPCLRLHGSESALRALMQSEWISGMRDHVHCGALTAVPAQVVHRRVFRRQAKSSPERVRRRTMRRHGLSELEANRQIPDSAAEMLALPFVQLQSGSTTQRFRLFIEHGPTQPEPVPGSFNTYGLSEDGTVPWF